MSRRIILRPGRVFPDRAEEILRFAQNDSQDRSFLITRSSIVAWCVLVIGIRLIAAVSYPVAQTFPFPTNYYCS